MNTLFNVPEALLKMISYLEPTTAATVMVYFYKHLTIYLDSHQNLRLISEIKHWQSLEIDLGSKDHSAQMEDLGKILQKLPHLQKVRITANDAAERDIMPLLRGLEGHTQLTDIKFASLIIGDLEAAVISGLLARQSQLELFACNFCVFTTLKNAGVILVNLKVHLKVLEWKYNEISGKSFGPEGAKIMAPVLKQIPRLAKLDIAYNQIGTQGAKSFACNLGKVPYLKVLELSGNEIDESGMQAIVNELKNNEITIKYFDDLEDENLVTHKIESSNVQITCPAYFLDNLILPELEELSQTEYSSSDSEID